ncbi:MAG TPA: hypothetical protein VFY36_05465 [Solirubrobacteraceae bacterium]|nr:hypothetical protein [Solirubrobacteraceae bacterium]
MNAELLSLVAVGGSGSAMLAGIAAREHAQAERMRASRVRLATRYPMNLEPAQVLAAWDGLAGLPYTSELVTELVASEGSITHSLLVPETARESVRATLTGVIPSLRIGEASPSLAEAATLSLRLFVPTSILKADNAVSASRSLLTGLAGLRADEQVAIRWALSPRTAPSRRQMEDPTPRDREIARAWASKTATPGFRVSGLVLIRAATASRARELASHIENLLRSRRGVLGGIRVTSDRSGRSLAALPKVRQSSGWLSVEETTPLLGLPLGDAVPGVEVGSRELLVSPGVARGGRVLFTGRDSRGDRPVALSPEAATHHMAVVGPSGVGKSVLLANAILSDIEAGHGGVVIDPKGDLIDTVLDRVPPRYAKRVVALDAGDDARAVPGMDVLHGGDADARADVLVRTLKSLVPEWGIRSETFGRLGLRTLGEVPGATLMDLGRLFADEPYRRMAVARLGDGFLRDSWQNYEGLSPAAKVDVVQAPMARVMALLSRPRVRAVIASADPKIDVSQLLADKRFVLVSLAPGALGEAATLIGAAVMFATWSAVEARVTLPPERRHLVNIYIDETATVVNGLPSSLELIAERARGLGASLTIAVQTLGRVPEPTRSALLGNLATLISFRAGATEAAPIARELPGISPDDLIALGRFEVAARVGTGAGSAVSVMTGRTIPLPPVTGQAGAIRDRSARVYGSAPTPPREQPDDDGDGDLVGSRRRQA